MTNGHTQVQREAGFDQRTLARVAGRVAELPAVATQDWVERVAETLAGLDPWCRVGVAIVNVDAGGSVRSIEAVGAAASQGERERMSDPKAETLAVRVRLERLSELGFGLPSTALTQGLAATGDELGGWKEGPLARVWGSSPVERLLVGLVPVGVDNTDRSVLIFMAQSPSQNGGPRANARTLGAVLPLLARRAWHALPASGPVAWMTDREQDVLDRLILGRSVREIAEELGRSPHTVHDHVKSLHRKLQASSRGELVAKALGHGSNNRRELDPMLLDRARAASQIEATPAAVPARRP